MKSETIGTFENDMGQEIKAKVDYYHGSPGKLYGPPEKCYPPEPAEVEIYDCTIGGFEYVPTDEELQEWTNQVLENPFDFFMENDPDPTPWCHACGSMTITGCKCPDPFYAENH